MMSSQPETHSMFAQTMLQDITDAICDRPGDSAADRAARSGRVVRTVLGFRPRDPVEMMLAGVAVLHVHLLLDSAREVSRGQDERLRARAKSSITALDRGLIGILKELHLARKRPLGVDEMVTEAAPEPAAMADAAPGPQPVDQPKAEVAKPKTPAAGPRAPGRAAPPEQLLRQAETSVAAMLAVLSPPMAPCAVYAGGLKPAAAPPVLAGKAVRVGKAERAGAHIGADCPVSDAGALPRGG
jgi:hypothetical protein